MGKFQGREATISEKNSVKYTFLVNDYHFDGFSMLPVNSSGSAGFLFKIIVLFVILFSKFLLHN